MRLGIWAGYDGLGCIRGTQSGAHTASTSVARTVNTSTVDKGVEKVVEKDVRFLLGKNKLSGATDLYFANLKKAPVDDKSMRRSLHALRYGEDAEALTVRSFTKVTKERAIEILQKADTPQFGDFDRDNDDNNFQYYSPRDAKKLIDYLQSRADSNASIYVADWDNYSSENFGVVFAVPRAENSSEVTLAHVTLFVT